MRALTIFFVDIWIVGPLARRRRPRLIDAPVAFSRVADQPGPNDGPEADVDDHEIAGPRAETKYCAGELETVHSTVNHLSSVFGFFFRVP